MGALEFAPATGPRPRPSAPLQVDALVALASDILSRRNAVHGSFTPEHRHGALQDILRVGTSAGGARAKAIIAWNPDTQEVRSGQARAPAEFGYWLLKFDGVSGNRDKELEDPQGYTGIEYAYSRMARAAGIAMSECRLLEEGGRRHFMTRRFDRTDDGRKIHMQSLAALNPSFEIIGQMGGFDAVAIQAHPDVEKVKHVHHAGNSSGIVDGAAALLIGNAEFGKAHGLKPRARIRATAKIGTDPTIMLTGPVPVTEKILREAGMSISDIDLFEVNEAFAAVVLRFLQAFDADPAKVNVNGGAIAMGHPLGATGAIIIGTLLDELERTGKGTGLATLCIASGMGAATIIERV